MRKDGSETGIRKSAVRDAGHSHPDTDADPRAGAVLHHCAGVHEILDHGPSLGAAPERAESATATRVGDGTARVTGGVGTRSAASRSFGFVAPLEDPRMAGKDSKDTGEGTE